jgi:mono/diheme cytochrome c family protein
MFTPKHLMFVVAALVGCKNNAASTAETAAGKPEPVAKLTPEAEAARGKHLVMVSACHDCHTPFKLGPMGPEPDFSRELSGHPAGIPLPPPPEMTPGWVAATSATNTAWAGPWGISFTANLTPDDETGTGTWSRQTFIDTIRNGRHMGAGRPLLPPMPAAMYANYSDEDLGAIYAYLRTVPAIKNKVPDPVAPEHAAGPGTPTADQLASKP